MAKVDHISGEMIDAFRGSVDFYYWKNIPVARSWPGKIQQPFTPGQNFRRQLFKSVSENLHKLEDNVIKSYKLMSQNISYSWRDLYFKIYLSYGYKYKKFNSFIFSCNNEIKSNSLVVTINATGDIDYYLYYKYVNKPVLSDICIIGDVTEYKRGLYITYKKIINEIWINKPIKFMQTSQNIIKVELPLIKEFNFIIYSIIGTNSEPSLSVPRTGYFLTYLHPQV